MLRDETNRHSVTSEYAYQTVWLKAFVDRVEITSQTETVAVHPRLSGKYEESIRFEHYARVLERKPGGHQHLKAKDKQPLPSRSPKSESSPFPQVHVQPPNLSQNYLGASNMIQPQALLLETHLKKLRLSNILRQYRKLATQAAEGNMTQRTVPAPVD